MKLLALFVGLISSVSAAQSVPSADEASLYNLLIQKVCIDKFDHPVPADPVSCPGHSRALRPGEPLPYHRYDQPHNQQHDSYPLIELDGTLVVNNPFNYDPFNEFNADGDGYDLYEVHDGWISVGQTRDGGGLSTTFFGEGCKPYNGWVFFPASAVQPDATVTAGEVHVPINSNYWEQNGDTSPGKCPPAFSRKSLTSWDTVRDFAFGGKYGNPIRKLTTVRSVHGFIDNADFRARGHLEVFYFTVPYGTTRWEVWTPKEQVDADPVAQHRVTAEQRACGGPFTYAYHGETFLVTECRDWSSLEVLKQPEPAPLWPLAGMNLLRNFHFTEGWADWTKSDDAKISLENSHAPSDTRYIQTRLGGQGVRFVRIDCTQSSACKQVLLTQNVSLEKSGIAPGVSVGFAATVRTESGSGEATLELTELDGDGDILGHSTTTHTVGSTRGHFTGEQSVTLSATFVHGESTFFVAPQARTLRWSIHLAPGHIYDLVDTWLLAPGK